MATRFWAKVARGDLMERSERAEKADHEAEAYARDARGYKAALGQAEADAERLAEALREIRQKTERKYVLRYRDRWTFADGIARIAREALRLHEQEGKP